MNPSFIFTFVVYLQSSIVQVFDLKLGEDYSWISQEMKKRTLYDKRLEEGARKIVNSVFVMHQRSTCRVAKGYNFYPNQLVCFRISTSFLLKNGYLFQD